MSCNDLTVSTTLPGVSIAPAGEIHGHVESAVPNAITYGNTGAYGPDAKVYVYENSKVVAILEVQQNYCFLEAGSVNCKVEAGTCKVDTTEGAYSGGIGGQIRILSVG